MRKWLVVSLCGLALGLALASGLLPSLMWLAIGAWALAGALLLDGGAA